MACTGTPVHDNPVFICGSWSLCNLPKWNKNQLHSSDLSYLWWLHTSVIRDADKIWGNYAEAKIILEWPVFIYCKLPVCIPVHVYFSRNNTVNCFCKFKCLVSARQRNSLYGTSVDSHMKDNVSAQCWDLGMLWHHQKSSWKTNKWADEAPCVFTFQS